MAKRKRPPLVVGWREVVALPELGVDALKAKVDTGARTSALHATRVREDERDGSPWVRFLVHLAQRGHGATLEVSAPLLEMREVRSSNGVVQRRPVIRTAVTLSDRSWPIELTLTARPEMGFRMLLGRTALRRMALVDPGRSYVASAKPPSEEG